MTKRNKKGFTIVELVVVIAVIAILSAVLIPTFVNLIHKAEFNNDKALVRNINTTLAISAEGADGEDTMYDTLVEVQKAGYIIENLTPRSSGSDIVWDSEHNQFVLVYKEGNATKTYTGTGFEPNMSKKENLWKIYSEVPAKANQDYSIYLKGEEYNTAVEVVGVGFDAGKNTTIPSVSYTNPDGAKEVTIRTNGGTLTVDAPNDTVNHYGIADDVSIADIDYNSYHEFGKVPYIEIREGHIEISSEAVVQAIHFLKNDSNKFDDIKITYSSGATLPEFSRDGGVDIDATSGTLVAEVVQQGADSEFIILTLNGIFEQIKIADDKNGNGSVWADDESLNEKTQTIAAQIANNYDGKAYGEYELDNSKIDSTTRELTDTSKATEGGKDATTVKNSTEAIISGSGTEIDPFVIKDSRTYVAWSKMAVDGIIGSSDYTTYVKCVGTIDLSGLELSTGFSICNVVYDGNNNGTRATFTNVNANGDEWYYLLGEEAYGTKNVIKNLVVENSYLGLGLVCDLQGELLIDNVKVKDTEAGHGVFVSQLWASSIVKTINITNCEADNVYVTGSYWGTGGFVGYLNGTANISNSTFLGTVNSSAGNVTGGVVGQKAGTLNCTNVEIKEGSVIRGLGTVVGAFANDSVNYNNNGNKFKGTLEVEAGKVTGCKNNGFEIEVNTFTPSINSSNLSILDSNNNVKTNENGNVVLTYTGNNTAKKLRITTELYWVDSVYFGAYNRQLNRMVVYADVYETNVQQNTEIDTTFKYISNVVNVVNENQSSYSRIDGQSTDTSKLIEGSEFNIIDGVFYFDAREGQDGWSNYISKSDRIIAIEVSELDENNHAISTVRLSYNFELGLGE